MTREKVGSVLVVGGGVGGVQAALDMADSGFKVYLVDRFPSIGGTMAQLDKTFPTNDCSMCILAPKLVTAGRHHNIELICNADLEDLKGEPGSFTATIVKHHPFVDEKICTGCGICSEHCPIEVPNSFDENMAPRKAIYAPFPQAVPLVYTIDKGACIGCGKCKSVCNAGAISFERDEEEIREVNVGAVVLSTGFEEFEAFRKREYGYGVYPNVITSIEFERMLSASGPTGGHLIRPSDGDIPQRIAFIQCVGSRDEKVGNNYCSSICCMAALKEAAVACEHEHGLECTIFFMDVRAFGKEFEEYAQRVEREYGVRVIRNNRIPHVNEDPSSNNLIIRYHEKAEILEDEFDLVILSVGKRPSKKAQELCRRLGVKLNKHGFVETRQFYPVDTSVPGIFASGAFTGPKDIPDTVAQSSGVASRVGALLNEVRGTEVQPMAYPEEKNVVGQEPRIGVFVCHCGINIGGVVDVPAVVEYARSLPDVVYAEENLYTCSQDSQSRIKEVIDEHALNRVVVASCTPRTHAPLFQNTIREAGLNPYLFDLANIRDQCSWVHMHEPEKATEKAKDLVRMSVARTALLSPLSQEAIPVTKQALVIGGGLSGMVAALEVASQGYPVHLVEKSGDLGGNLRRIHYLITGENPQRTLEVLRQSINDHPLVTVHLNTTVGSVEGYVGNFRSTLTSGEVIDHGVIILATGGVEYRPTEYLYGKSDRVITQTELGDKIAAGHLSAKTVVVIQCVGSRNQDYVNCSRICCATSMTNALELKRRYPETTVYVLFKDIRTYGFHEEHFTEAAREGVVFLRYDDSPPVVEEEDGRLVVRVTDQFLQENLQIHPDLIVLNAAVRPNPDNEELAKMLKVPLTHDGWFLEAHVKLRPVDFATEGIFMAGMTQWPKMVDESISQACGAAARAVTVLSKDTLEAEANYSVVNEMKCRGCGRCEEICPYGAARVIEVSPGILKCSVNPAMCKGCGACAGVCCNGAISVRHFTNEQILSMVESAFQEVLE